MALRGRRKCRVSRPNFGNFPFLPQEIHAETRSGSRLHPATARAALLGAPNTEVMLLTDCTDEQLLAQALAGEEEAFAALYHRRQGPIFRFALHMSGSTQIAEEVTQDVFIFLLQRGRDFDPQRGALGAYLFGVARNYVRRALERNYPETVLSSPIEDEAASLMIESSLASTDCSTASVLSDVISNSPPRLIALRLRA